MSVRIGIASVCAAVLALLVILVLHGPLSLPPGYHEFADRRTLLAIPNFMDVTSNGALLLAASLGFARCTKVDAVSRRAWRVFFAGVAFAAAGSAYYHWAPHAHTILWDQLGIALSCAALVTAIAADRIGGAAQRLALAPLLAVAALSLVPAALWHDYTFYAWVQGGALLAVALLALAFRGFFSHRRYIGYGLVLYALARLAELGDAAVFEWTAYTVSGHTLKHILSAAAVAVLAAMLARRTRRR